MAETRRNSSSGFLCGKCKLLNSVAAHARSWTGNTDGGRNFAALVEHWSGDTSCPEIRLLVIHRVALLHDAHKLFSEACKIWNSARSGPLKGQHRQDLFAHYSKSCTLPKRA